jgi:hypothetical protein
MAKIYASAIVKLLQSRAVYDNDKYWQMILQNEGSIKSYFEDIGVGLEINKSDGIARLVPLDFDEDEANQPIKLIRKTTLNYDQSLIAIVLREWLDEYEVSNIQSSSRLFITKSQLRDRVELLIFKDSNNRKALFNKMDALIEKMVEHNFLELFNKDELNPENSRYEVKSLLKIKINNEKLEEFKNQLYKYVESI